MKFWAKYEVNFMSKIGSKTVKFKGFGNFDILISVIEFLKLCIWIFLVKIQLLVASLYLWGLVSRFHGQKNLKKEKVNLKIRVR